MYRAAGKLSLSAPCCCDVAFTQAIARDTRIYDIITSGVPWRVSLPVSSGQVADMQKNTHSIPARLEQSAGLCCPGWGCAGLCQAGAAARLSHMCAVAS